MHMMDLMSSIIMEGDGVTQELLDTILINLIPAHKVTHIIVSPHILIYDGGVKLNLCVKHHLAQNLNGNFLCHSALSALTQK